MKFIIVLSISNIFALNASIPIVTLEEWEKVMSSDKPVFIGSFEQYDTGYGHDFIATAEKFNGTYLFSVFEQ